MTATQLIQTGLKLIVLFATIALLLTYRKREQYPMIKKITPFYLALTNIYIIFHMIGYL